MPAFVCDPACGDRRETQPGAALGTAAEDAEAAAHGRVELSVRDAVRRLSAQLGVPYCIEREQAQCIDAVAPGQQVSVLAVVQQALR
jgi:hypothetical protein